MPHGNYLGWYPDTVGKGGGAAHASGSGVTDRVFLFLGQIRRYKGVEDLLAVFRQLDAPDARLIVAGRPTASGPGSGSRTRQQAIPG